MSRGGGRGGRRGGRRGGMSNMPWENDPNLELDGRPSELFPEYDVPTPAPLSKKEDRQVSYFLLFREQVHDGPLYTQTRMRSGLDDGEPGRVYGQEQINKRYGVRSRASIDPFLAMPSYSQRFDRQERSLPDLASRPFAREFFPPELHPTLDGADSAAAGGRRRPAKKALLLSNITSLRTAEDVFMPEAAGTGENGENGSKAALRVLDRIGNGGEDGGDDDLYLDGAGAGDDGDDDDWIRPGNADGEGEVEDEDQYEDESGDDYNAEQYFEENQPDDDYDEGGEGGDDIY